MRIGVYVCECGINISNTVDVDEVAKYAGTLPDVHTSRVYKYMCSDPGQEMIKNDIREEGLTRVVVASCSPRMHEPTFRNAVEEAGLNPYCFEMANIREHCSWVHTDRETATRKAMRIVAAAVLKSAFDKPLDKKEVPVTHNAMVIGAGIAGIQASLDIADSGYKVYLVEKDSTIGGRMAQLDKTFPTLDCSACILTPKMSDVPRHPNIELLTYSEVEDISGYVGNFRVSVKKKARYVNTDKCTGCGVCSNVCPVHNVIQVPEPVKTKVTPEIKAVDAIIDRYEAKRDALIQILQDANKHFNYLPEAVLRRAAERLGIPFSEVYGTASFYKSFSLTPRGKHIIQVCMGTACHVRGASRILEEFERRLCIRPGENTEDGLFTLERVNCLGACALGPIIAVDGDYHGQMTTGKVSRLIDTYAKKDG
ncbi:MAG: NAD(P)H-dependent oxidoreductase subunit E [Spirochaetales bacterium]|nr:NAD(P)H-dependent oxidoreductase subunit E [Spirochaetales bacterium]